MVRRSTWILLGVFALLVGFTFLFQRYQTNNADNAATATPTTSKTSLYDLVSSQVTGVDIADSSGEQIKLLRDPDTSVWTIGDVPMEQVDAAQIESVIAQLLSLEVQEELFQIPPLESIRLDTPDYTITARTSEGTEKTIYVGSKTPIGSGYYVRLDTGKVVIVDNLALDEVLDMLKNPPLLPTPTQSTTTPATTPDETFPPVESTPAVTPSP